ncbi:MAG TPA: MmcQ/YjbR family DNA-binding protein [Candidatus Anoxymicrobiaceae bacterium]
MPKFTFEPARKEALDAFLLDNPEVEPGKAFGMPAYYVNGKMFARVFGDGVTVKLPADDVGELLEREGVSEFQPMEGRKMKNWVVIRRDDPSDLVKDRDIFQTAFDYVYALTKEAPRKKK